MKEMSAYKFLGCSHLFTADNAGCITSAYPFKLLYSICMNIKLIREMSQVITHALSSSGVASGNRSFIFEVILR